MAARPEEYALGLFNYQARCVNWLTVTPKALIALEPGLGKSLIAIEDLMAPALIVCPAFLIPNWLREIKKWRPSLQARAFHKNDHTPSEVIVQSYEMFAKHPPQRPINTLILDESHYVKTPTAKRTKAAMKLVRATPRVRLLSGTPFLGRPIELWAMMNAMGVTRLDYRSWGFHYCAGYIDHWGNPNFRGVTQKNMPELAALIEPVTFRLTKKEALELPPKKRRLVVINAPVDRAEREYDVRQIKDAGSPTPFVGLAEVLHHHGLAKVPAVVEHCLDVLDQEEKLIVFAHHRDVCAEIAAALAAKKISVAVINGSTSTVIRDQLTQEFQTGKLRVLVGNHAAMGTGLTLTACRYVVMAESSWSHAVNDQCESRVERIGQTLPIQIDYMVVDGSIDSQMVEVALMKSRVSAEVLGDNQQRRTTKMEDNHELLKESGRQLAAAFGAFLTLLVLVITKEVHGDAPAPPKANAPEPPKENGSAPTAAVEQAKRGRPPKAAEPAAPTVTQEQVDAKFRELLGPNREFIDDGKAVLAELGVAKIKDIPPKKFGAAVAAIDKILAGRKAAPPAPVDDDPFA